MSRHVHRGVTGLLNRALPMLAMLTTEGVFRKNSSTVCSSSADSSDLSGSGACSQHVITRSPHLRRQRSDTVAPSGLMVIGAGVYGMVL